jgi:hypothetical protein
MSKSAIAWFFAMTGVLVGAFAIQLMRRLSRQKEWPKTPGVITSSAVDFLWETYRANVQYRYVIDAEEYIGKTIRSWMLQYNWRGPATRLCGRFPVGSKVDVYVSPADKSYSVLEPGGDRYALWLVGTASIVLILASVVLAIG